MFAITMRYLILICWALCTIVPVSAERYSVENVPNAQVADRTRYVSNPDGILSPAAVTQIDSICAQLRQKAIAQVAVVAVTEIDQDDVFSFAIDLFSKWGVGRAGNNNGLGILLVEDVHEIRFVTGGGLEGVLPDAICKRIQLKYMLPHFREDDYSAGMVAGMQAVAGILNGSELDLGETDVFNGDLPSWAIFLIVLGFIVVPLGVIMGVYYYQKRCPKCHSLTLVQQSQTILQTTSTYRLVEYTYVCSKCGAVVKRRAKNLRDDNISGGAGGGMIIGGGRGFGGGGSMGGGFGGGSFGGGGAGSRW
ncbi:MAG: TPM domain-containing protein [Alistipes sp.]